MIVREDLHPSVTIPDHVKECLLRVGGKNPFGEPMYRLILAEDRVTRAAGEWAEWDEGIPMEERGSLGINQIQEMLAQHQEKLEEMRCRGAKLEELQRVSQHQRDEIEEMFKSRLGTQPIRIERGDAEVPLYGCKGFVLEKWKTAESFGSPADWYAYRFEGKAALGPYPQYGDYEMIAGPSPRIPSESELEHAVRCDYRAIENKSSSPKERFTLLMRRYEDRQAAKRKQQNEELTARIKDGPGSLYNRVSLGAGRVRQQLADAAGLKGHYGN